MPGRWSLAGRWVVAVDMLYLAALLGFVLVSMSPSLHRTWFFSSDEYVIGAEVIRFVHLDFYQQFFDMPGTPFMLLTALVWSAYFLAHVVTGGAGFDIGVFTYQHIETLFVLMRALTLLFFCLSVVLVYALTARLTNRFGAWTAALILATSPIYTSYSSFVRVESLSMCFMLGSLLCVVAWTPSRPRLLLASGVLAGLAAATRFHSMTAFLPVLVLFVAWRKEGPVEDYPRWAKMVFVAACAAVVVANLIFLTGPPPLVRLFPLATAFLRTMSRAAAVGLALVGGAYVLKSTRRLLLRLVPPDTVALLCAFGVGLVLGTPTILWRFYPSFLQSIEAYRTSYIDFSRATWPLWQNVTWYVNFYIQEAAPGSIVPALLLAGAVLAVVLRHVEILWILAGAVLFFASKPINLLAAPHHIILWLPFYAIVAAFPVAVVWWVVSGQPTPVRLGAGAALAAGLALLWTSLAPAVQSVGRNQALTEQRLRNIVHATAWLKDNAERDTTVLVAYFCFNPDIVYSWFRAMNVPVPETVKDGRTWVIWWGHARTFKGKSGYALATRSDVASLKTRIDSVQPGQGTDPYTDPRFTLARSFGQIPTQVDVFRFDDSSGAAGAVKH